MTPVARSAVTHPADNAQHRAITTTSPLSSMQLLGSRNGSGS